MSALPEDMFSLAVEERLRLVEDLWESIREHPESLPLSDVQREELDRRLRAYRANPEAAASLEVALDKLRNRE